MFKPVKSDKFYNRKQLAIGTKVELEHTYSKRIAKKIAKHHLDEHPAYYIELEKMEKI